MQQIESSGKKANGIEVFWKEATGQKRDFFSFSELIEMQINSIDLLDHPNVYQIDPANHRIVASVKGCCTYT